MSLIQFFEKNKRKKNIEKYLKSYVDLNNKMNDIEGTFESLIKTMSYEEAREIIDNQKKYVSNTMKEIAISLDVLVDSYIQNDSEILDIYLKKLPKHSDITNSLSSDISDFEVQKHYFNVKKFHSNNLDVKHIHYIFNLFIQHKDNLSNINTYLKYLEKKNLNKPMGLLKIKKIKEYQIHFLQKKFLNYFKETNILLNQENIYEVLPEELSFYNISLHALVRNFIENKIISKDNPYKSFVENIPLNYKTHTDKLGIFGLNFITK